MWHIWYMGWSQYVPMDHFKRTLFFEHGEHGWLGTAPTLEAPLFLFCQWGDLSWEDLGRKVNPQTDGHYLRWRKGRCWWISPCYSLRQGVHAQTHCWLCILYCFLQCFLLLDNAALGGGGGGRNNCFFEWCFLPLSICTGFYSVFRAFALLFFAPSAFSLGFYSVLRLHDVAHATLHIGVGWGWGNRVHANLITLLRLHHVADATLHIGVGWGGVRWGGC